MNAVSNSSLSPRVKAFFDEPTNTFSYVVQDPTSNACAIIDSVLDFDYPSGTTDVRSANEIIAHVREHELEVEWILETHVHADHLSAAPWLHQALGGKTGIGARITVVQETFGKAFNAGTEFARDGSQFDRLFEEGDRFAIGNLEGRVLHTPGHTPACLTYVIGDAAFVGDTLFMPDYGTARCDFPGGDAARSTARCKRFSPCRMQHACSFAMTTRLRVVRPIATRRLLRSSVNTMCMCMKGSRRMILCA